ncbi:MAG TPA: alpha/beta fold hydrolase, partial [Thermoleophilaceae bacterium]|nr:alpha/beta fold hydrolase [Thermoleophilaceae bacterium]
LAPAAAAESSLDNPPPGANDFGCKPSAAHPEPVVLVHGLGATMGENWGYIAPILKARGYCVFALTYGMDPRFRYAGGVIPIEQSAEELRVFVDRVLASTGAAKVDLVGHSEGTFMPQWWLKFLGGAAKTDDYVAMTPLYDGTTLAGLDRLRDALAPFGLSQPVVDGVSRFCASCPQFLRGSETVEKLKAGGKAAPGVDYTTILTRYDELVVPYTSGLLPAPATNHIVQRVCPNDISEHAAVAFDPVVARLILNALDPATARTPSCLGLPPLAPPPA